MTAMILKLTAAGRAAMVNSEHTGTAALRIAQIGITAQTFVPSDQLSALPGEFKRLTTFGGTVVAADAIHLTLSDESDDQYTLRGFGLYSDTGLLVATYGQQAPIMEKSTQSILMLAVDGRIADLLATTLAFDGTNWLNPPATTEIQGVAELATVEEAIEGADDERIVTPAALKAALAQAIARNRYVPGQVITIAGNQVPDGLLLCNGAAVSRTQYASLFAAIGTTYGAGDGVTTFNVPNVKEGTVITHTNDLQKIGQFTAGQTISHVHAALAAAVADHTHYLDVKAGGAHVHAASATAVGDHSHSAWTDTQGWHGHTGATTTNGNHQHAVEHREYGAAGGGISGTWSAVFGGVNNAWTSWSGDHNHTLYIDGNGSHGHNVVMNGAGAHSHALSVATAGDHTHVLDNRGAGAHTHSISVLSTGGSDNLPAGLRMMYCIAH